MNTRAKSIQWVKYVTTHFIAILVDLIVDIDIFSWLYISMPKTKNSSQGFSHILVLIAFLAVVGAIGFFVSPQKNNQDEVLGSAQATSSAVTRSGFSVVVNSSESAWDFFEFLCTTYEECTQSLTSGFQLSIISGGPTQGYEIFVEPSRDWESYKFIKYYVKPTWTGSSALYTPSALELVQGSQTHTFDSTGVQAVIVPLEPFKTQFYHATSFSDQ